MWLDLKLLLRNYVGAYNQPGHDGNVYLCFQNNAAGTVGIAWIGTICGPQNYQTAIVEYFNSDTQTGEVGFKKSSVI